MIKAEWFTISGSSLKGDNQLDISGYGHSVSEVAQSLLSAYPNAWLISCSESSWALIGIGIKRCFVYEE